MADDELTEALDTALLTSVSGGIKRARGDEGEIETHGIADLIALDKYRRSRSRGNPLGHIRLTKLIPPGAE